MIQAISSLNPYIDSEYLIIIQELHALGLSPTGNKSNDKLRLAQAKQNLINKIQFNDDKKLNTKEEIIINDNKANDINIDITEAEIKMLGATLKAELNRLYFNL